MLITPVLLNIQELKTLWTEGKQLAEGLLVLCVITAVAAAIFSRTLDAQFLYLLVPLIIWSAVRGGALAASISILSVAAIGVFFSATGRFALLEDNVNTTVLSLQEFAAVLSLTGLTVAAALAEVRDSEVKIRRALSAAETNEAKYRTLVQFAPEAIVVLDVDVGLFCVSWTLGLKGVLEF